MKSSKTLHDLLPGESGVIQGVTGEGRLQQRLLEMGFVPGVTIAAERTAPMGDPMAFSLRGYRICLRRHEAATILLAA